MVKVSIIVPVYNGEATIKRCLMSICAQTLCDIEIIVVNDGSTDNTAAETESVCDERIKVITIENSGQGIARNYGIEAASGEYLAFVDADDTIENDMLLHMYTVAKSENSDLVQCNIRDIYPDGTEKLQLDLSDETVHIQDSAEYMDLYFTTCRHSYEVCNKLVKRQTAADLRFGDTGKYFSEDLLFNLGLIERISTVTFIKEAYYNYFQSETSHLHSDKEKRLIGLCALFRDYIENAPAHMRDAAAYTAAMVLSYSAGECEKNVAAEMFESEEFCEYVMRAVKRSVKMSHRLFLTAMRMANASGKAALCRKFAGRWS